MNKDLGLVGMIIFSLILTLISFVFLPIALYIVTLPAALIFGIISLMRSVKEKNGGRIFFSILTVILPLTLFGFTYLALKIDGDKALKEAQERRSEYDQSIEEANKQFDEYDRMLDEANKN